MNALSPAQLDKNLHNFEVLHADTDLQHSVVKRGSTHSSHPFNTIKEVRFAALGRQFRLILHPHRQVLHSKFRAYTVDSSGREKVVHVGMFCLVRGEAMNRKSNFIYCSIFNIYNNMS